MAVARRRGVGGMADRTIAEKQEAVWLATGHTDMRKGFASLNFGKRGVASRVFARALCLSIAGGAAAYRKSVSEPGRRPQCAKASTTAH
jgi:hypothetical protein